MSLSPGHRLGPYEVLGPLGSGGMGEVYRARDARLERTVALKVLPPQLAAHETYRQRFQREARAASALSHAHIAQVYDVGEQDGTHFIVMEYVEGENLRDVVSRGPLGRDQALEIGIQIAAALEEAHSHGIVHRDIKPANVIVSPKGQIKVLDFGLARRTADGGVSLDSQLATQAQTRAGDVIGTVHFMSPEQALGRDVDGRTDIFSYGVLLYELATGRLPFTGTTAAETIDRICHATPEAISHLNRDMPEELERIVRKCLEKDREQRYTTAHDLLADLRNLQRDRKPGTGQAKPSPLHSLAVLPFANLSADPEQEYFCDGMAEEITADLSALRGLRVISRSSTIRMKGTRKDVRTIGQELGVRYVLEGSVRRAGRQLRITAQLIDTQEDMHLWANKYDGTLDEVFDIQERVARSVVEALKIKLSASEDYRIAERPIENVQAFECYLRARQEMHLFTEESFDRALRLLENGLALAGENVLLYSLMGNVYLQYVNSLIRPRDPYLRSAEDCAQKILALAPTSSHGYWLRGALRHKRGDVQGAVRLLKQALVVDTHHPDALYWLSYAYRVSGKGLAAKPLVERLVSIDPLSAYSHWAAGWIEFFEGDIQQALRSFGRMYELDPKSSLNRWAYGFVLAASGRHDEASPILEAVIRDAPRTFYGRHGRFLKLAFETGSRPARP